MKKLIQIQAVVNAIEDLTMSEKKYHSSFEYKSKREMVIKTYAVEQTLNLMQTLKHGNGYCLYVTDNNTIEVLELPFDNENSEE